MKQDENEIISQKNSLIISSVSRKWGEWLGRKASLEGAEEMNLPAHLRHCRKLAPKRLACELYLRVLSCHQPTQGTEEESFLPGPASLQGSESGDLPTQN